MRDIDPRNDDEVIQDGYDDNVLRCTPDGRFYVEETIYRYVTPSEAGRYYIASCNRNRPTGRCLAAALDSAPLNAALDSETARDLKLTAERFNLDSDDLLRRCLAWALRENAEGRANLFESREPEDGDQ